MTRFWRARDGIRAAVGETDALLLGQVMAEMVEVVRSEAEDPPVADDQDWARELGLVAPTAAPQPPTDPVSARLFPDAYRDDADASAEFRRFTESELRETKAAHATAVLHSLPDGGGEVLLDEDGVEAWLGALNDARLALGTALGVQQDVDRELESTDPESIRGQRLLVYDWLGYVQSALLDVLLGD